MSFFCKTKFKVKITTEQDKVMFYINYFNVKNSDNIKSRLLQELIGESCCLATINTNMLYPCEGKNTESIVTDLINLLDKLHIRYSKKAINRDYDTKMFGMTVNMDGKKTHKDYIIGFTIKSENLESMHELINSYTFHYYITKSYLAENELLNKFDINFYYEENLKTDFDYDVLDNNFAKQLAIFSSHQDLTLISNIIDKVISR